MKKIYLIIQLVVINLSAVAQITPLANITIPTVQPICSPGGCVDLITEFSILKSTSSYEINSIPFGPSFPFTGGTIIPPSGDDYWSPEVVLPFSFSFFGNCYNSLFVGTNGVITFDTVNNVAFGFCPWQFTQTIPNTGFPIRNAIYGVYQDSDIRQPPVTNYGIQNVNYFVLETGVNVAPNRVFVINFNELPQFQCNTTVGLQTSQIIIHETTGIIDILVKNRSACTTWNGGLGLIGIQNQDGTIGFTPPGRNSGTWSATNEAWRISPSGPELPQTFSWYNNDVLIPEAVGGSLTVCPTNSDNFKVKMSIGVCPAEPSIVESNTISDLIAPDSGLIEPQDLTFCTQSPFVYSVDLDVNLATMFSGTANPLDYGVKYYENLIDAENDAINNITNFNSYTFTQSKTIYAALEELVQTGCRYIKPFDLIIVPPVSAPTGNSLQNFISGQTLADLVVIGESIIWYDAPSDGNVLPDSTVLQNGATYYAAQSISGCESGNGNSSWLAVTVNLVLSSDSFSDTAAVIYPNPATEFITISSKGLIKSVRISNLLGQNVLAVEPNKNEDTIAISNFPNGIYFLTVQTSIGIKTVKVVKE